MARVTEQRDRLHVELIDGNETGKYWVRLPTGTITLLTRDEIEPLHAYQWQARQYVQWPDNKGVLINGRFDPAR